MNIKRKNIRNDKKQIKEAKYNVSEWEWLKLQLEIYALKYKSEMYSVLFDFTSGKRYKIICKIFSKHAYTMIANKTARAEQLEYYEDWAEKEKQVIKEILNSLPILKKTIDLNKDVEYQIMYSYGMGASLICAFKNKKVDWSQTEDSTVT